MRIITNFEAKVETGKVLYYKLMKALEWRMTIPKEKEEAFTVWFINKAGPMLGKFGAIRHELFKVESEKLVGGQITESQRYIERVYFSDDFSIPRYFESVRNNPEAWEISRQYESKFNAREIELRVINSRD